MRSLAIGSIALAVLLALLPAAEQPVARPQREDDSAAFTRIVDGAAGEFFKSTPQAVGVSIGILKNGKTYTFNYGSKQKHGKEAPTADSLYPIASITKTFTGALLAEAALEKKLSLDDDVRKYLDGDYPNLEFQGHTIRMEQLVNHRSGLPFNLPDIPETKPPFPTPISAAVDARLDRYTRKDFLRDLHGVKLETVPGEKFSYSNSAAVLASIILERLYGEPYEELVKRKIAHPLQMTDTTISMTTQQRSRLMKGYDQGGNVQPYPRDMILGAGALKSTVNDMLRYAEWQTAEAAEPVRLSHKATFTAGNYAAGLNWQMITAGSYRRVWQEGDLPGFESICTTYPELKMAVVVLANQEDRSSSHALTLMSNEIARKLDARTDPLLF